MYTARGKKIWTASIALYIAAILDDESQRLIVMKPSQALHRNREQILEIAARHGATNVRVFGSVARGEDTERSDLDLLVDMDDECSLSDLGEFVEDLRDVLNCKVQAVTSDGLNRLLRERILNEAVAL